MNDLQLDDLLSFSFLDEKVPEGYSQADYFPVYNTFQFEEWLALQVNTYERNFAGAIHQ